MENAVAAGAGGFRCAGSRATVKPNRVAVIARLTECRLHDAVSASSDFQQTERRTSVEVAGIAVITLLIRIDAAVAAERYDFTQARRGASVPGRKIPVVTLLRRLNKSVAAERKAADIQGAGVAADIAVHPVAVVALFRGIADGVTATRELAVGATGARNICIPVSFIALFEELVDDAVPAEGRAGSS